ncbi:FkbM family methyltransferase [Candidatus Woesearchaeota archaeon]|nr:FkbM family methyltransferase [Candidatus Woesearchaeota archaeon]
MSIVSMFSKIIPEGKLKDILRIPVYRTMIFFKFSKKETTIMDEKVKFCSFPWSKPSIDKKEIAGYFENYFPRKGDIIVDAGAYVGHFAIIAAKLVGDSGKVIVFEPDPFNKIELKKNIKANGIKNIVLIEKGLSNKEGKFNWNIGGVESQIGKGFFEIKTTTLDKALKNNKRIDLIKMDIEGAEIDALEGANSTLNKTKHCAIASYHIVNGKKTCFEVEKILKRRKFHVKTKMAGQLLTFGDRK